MSVQVQAKRVLVVDDERNLANVLADTLRFLDTDYEVDVAHSAKQALDQLHDKEYQLLLTDYMMPGMSGLELIRLARRVAPNMKIVLMSAYGGKETLQRELNRLELTAYVDKPFAIDEIREIVQTAVEDTRKNQAEQYETPLALSEAVSKELQQLQINTNAEGVLLVSANGHPIEVVGPTHNLDVFNISALVAANFVAAAELANLLGNASSIFKSSYHEGSDYNIYSYDVNGELLLSVVFSAHSKPGTVWFYTKQTVEELVPLVERMEVLDQNTMEETFDDDFESELNGALDFAFDDGSDENGFGDFESLAVANMTTEDSDGTAELIDTDSADSAESEKEAASEEPASPPQRSVSFEEAIAAGLVPKHIIDRETTS